MKIWIESPYKNNLAQDLKKLGVKIDRHKPDFVVTYGGDGTILRAERRYPGVPKIPIRKSHNCNMCVDDLANIETIMERISKKQYRIEKFEKVDAAFGQKVFVGLNEIQIHNKDPRKALRFNLLVGGKKFANLIGDGLVFSTAYGSTAYYRAIGNKPFKSGIKIGFNNVHPKQTTINLTGKATVEIIREKALLIADNDGIIELKPGNTVEVSKSKQRAAFVRI